MTYNPPLATNRDLPNIKIKRILCVNFFKKRRASCLTSQPVKGANLGSHTKKDPGSQARLRRTLGLKPD